MNSVIKLPVYCSHSSRYDEYNVTGFKRRTVWDKSQLFASILMVKYYAK
jgi:hypothetical protein